ncbi:MAG: hypothetical protein QM765_02855 [Myxococcales bacterium]
MKRHLLIVFVALTCSGCVPGSEPIPCRNDRECLVGQVCAFHDRACHDLPSPDASGAAASDAGVASDASVAAGSDASASDAGACRTVLCSGVCCMASERCVGGACQPLPDAGL